MPVLRLRFRGLRISGFTGHPCFLIAVQGLTGVSNLPIKKGCVPSPCRYHFIQSSHAVEGSVFWVKGSRA